MYSIVETVNDNGEKDASMVCSSWIKNGIVYWPKTENYYNALKQQLEVEASWEPYSCKILKDNISAYTLAKENLEFFLEHTCSESERIPIPTTSKRSLDTDFDELFDEKSKIPKISVKNELIEENVNFFLEHTCSESERIPIPTTSKRSLDTDFNDIFDEHSKTPTLSIKNELIESTDQDILDEDGGNQECNVFDFIHTSPMLKTIPNIELSPHVYTSPKRPIQFSPVITSPNNISFLHVSPKTNAKNAPKKRDDPINAISRSQYNKLMANLNKISSTIKTIHTLQSEQGIAIAALQEETCKHNSRLRDELETIKFNSNRTNELLEKLVLNSNTVRKTKQIVKDSTFTYPITPMSTVEELDSFNLKLAELYFMEQMIVRLYRFKTPNVNTSIKYIMEHLFEYGVICKYSWTGQSGIAKGIINKHIFMSLTGVQNLIENVLNYLNVDAPITVDEVRKGIQQFLKRASINIVRQAQHTK